MKPYVTQLELFDLPVDINELCRPGYYYHAPSDSNQLKRLNAAQSQLKADQLLRAVGLPDYTTCVSTCHYAIEAIERERRAVCSPNSEVDESCTAQTLNLAKKIKREYNAAHGVIACKPK